MLLLTFSVFLKSPVPTTCNSTYPKDCSSTTNHYHIVLFFSALYIIALGNGGTRANITAMGAQQFDVFEEKEGVQVLSYFNYSTFFSCFGHLFSITFIVYIQENISWSVGYAVPTIMFGLSIVTFVVGTPFYRHKPPSGSPITRIAMVLVAACRKYRVRDPQDPNFLHEFESEHYIKLGWRKIDQTPSFTFLNNAAVMSGADSPWMLCSVTQVEETKQLIKLLPMFFVTLVPSIMLAQLATLFIKQGTTLDRRLGHGFTMPSASLTIFFLVTILAVTAIYDKYVVKLIRKYTKNPRGMSMLQRMGVGQIFHIVTMIVAALIERWRLRHEQGGVPLTFLVLLPQLMLMGIAVMLVEVGKMEFFYDQAPQGMKSIGSSFFSTSMGIGNFLSSFLLSAISEVTKTGGKKGWIENDLNESRLDYYYGFFAALNVINFVFYLVFSRNFVYNDQKNVKLQNGVKGAETQIFPEESLSSKN